MYVTVIERWLIEKLGIIVKDTESLGPAVQNGQIIAMLLVIYGVAPECCIREVPQAREPLNVDYERIDEENSRCESSIGRTESVLSFGNCFVGKCFPDAPQSSGVQPDRRLQSATFKQTKSSRHGGKLTDKEGHGKILADKEGHGKILADKEGHGKILTDKEGHGKILADKEGHGKILADKEGHGKILADKEGHGKILADKEGHGKILADKGSDVHAKVDKCFKSRTPMFKKYLPGETLAKRKHEDEILADKGSDVHAKVNKCFKSRTPMFKKYLPGETLAKRKHEDEILADIEHHSEILANKKHHGEMLADKIHRGEILADKKHSGEILAERCPCNILADKCRPCDHEKMRDKTSCEMWAKFNKSQHSREKRRSIGSVSARQSIDDMRPYENTNGKLNARGITNKSNVFSENISAKYSPPWIPTCGERVHRSGTTRSAQSVKDDDIAGSNLSRQSYRVHSPWKLNYKYLLELKRYLIAIRMQVNDCELRGIAQGNTSDAFKFLYALYLHLESSSVKKPCNSKRCNSKQINLPHRSEENAGFRPTGGHGEQCESVEQKNDKGVTKKSDEGGSIPLNPPNDDQSAQNLWVSNNIERFEIYKDAFPVIVHSDRRWKKFELRKRMKLLEKKIERKLLVGGFTSNRIEPDPLRQNVSTLIELKDTIMSKHKLAMEKKTQEKLEHHHILVAEYEQSQREYNEAAMRGLVDLRKQEKRIVALQLASIACRTITRDLVNVALRCINPNVKVPGVLWTQWMQEFINGLTSGLRGRLECATVVENDPSSFANCNPTSLSVENYASKQDAVNVRESDTFSRNADMSEQVAKDIKSTWEGIGDDIVCYTGLGGTSMQLGPVSSGLLEPGGVDLFREWSFRQSVKPVSPELTGSTSSRDTKRHDHLKCNHKKTDTFSIGLSELDRSEVDSSSWEENEEVSDELSTLIEKSACSCMTNPWNTKNVNMDYEEFFGKPPKQDDLEYAFPKQTDDFDRFQIGAGQFECQKCRSYKICSSSESSLTKPSDNSREKYGKPYYDRLAECPLTKLSGSVYSRKTCGNPYYPTSPKCPITELRDKGRDSPHSTPVDKNLKDSQNICSDERPSLKSTSHSETSTYTTQEVTLEDSTFSSRTEHETFEDCLVKQTLLAKADLQDYLNFERSWIKDEIDPVELDQDTLGFIVTKLLGLLAPVPLTPAKACIPSFDHACCLLGLPPEMHDVFRTILKEHDILFITVDRIVEFCISEYKKSLVASEQKYNFCHETSKMYDTSEYSSILGENQSFASLSLPNFYKKTKETQTPALLPEPPPQAVWSAAHVGELLAEKLLAGGAIPGHLIVKSLLCFLKEQTPDDWVGWVLLDFPKEIRDLCELESHLKGEFVPVHKNKHPSYAEILPYMSKLVPFSVNFAKNATSYEPCIDQFISINTGTRNANTDTKYVYEFYMRFNRFMDFSPPVSLSSGDNTTSFEPPSLTSFQPVLKFIIDAMDLYPAEFKSSTFPCSEPCSLYEYEEYAPSHIPNYVVPKIYTEIQAAPSFLSLLGKLWQVMESRYLAVLGQLFMLKREENANMMIFGRGVEELLLDPYDLPSAKQKIVDEFQATFTCIPYQERTSVDVKARLYKELAEFQERLLDVCMENHTLHKDEVADPLAGDRWCGLHLEFTCKVYLAILNEEMHRFMDTLQLIADYYLLAMSKNPPYDKLQAENNPESITVINAKNIGICVEFIEAQGFEVNFQPWVEEISAICEACVDDMTAVHTKLSSDESYADLREDVMDQMSTVLTDEMTRVLLRVDLIQRKLVSEVEEFEHWYSSLLNDNYLQGLGKLQESEVNAVNTLCVIFAFAIEEETPVYDRLLLRDVKPLLGETLPMPSPPPHPSGPGTRLTPPQVEHLRQLFKSAAPHGFLPFPHFIFLLRRVQQHGNNLPHSWNNLTSRNLTHVLHAILGRTTEYCWRDFIIHLLEIPILHGCQLIQMATEWTDLDVRHTGFLSWSDFQRTRMWFEQVFSEEEMQMKEILFNMFKTGDDRTDYVQLLLHLCKRESAVKGFTLALCLAHLLEFAQCRLNASESKLSFADSKFSVTDSQLHLAESKLELDSTEDDADYTKTPQISFASFCKVVRTYFQHHFEQDFQEDLEGQLKDLETSWLWPQSVSHLLRLLRQEKFFLNTLEATHKFQACKPSAIVLEEIRRDKAIAKKKLEDAKKKKVKPQSSRSEGGSLPMSPESLLSFENDIFDDIYFHEKFDGLF